MRFAFYGRVSDEELQNPELSIPAQRAQCVKRLTKAAAGDIVCDYQDVGASGDSYRRPGLDAMLADGVKKNPPFDHIVVFSIDRISRGAGVLDLVEKVLRPNEIFIWEALDDNDPRNPGCSLVRGVKAVVAGAEKQTTIVRSKMVMEMNTKLGWQNGGRIPFGYRARIVPREDPRKKPQIALEVDPEYGPIVKLIFDLYVFDGCGPKLIASRLNEMRVQTPEWAAWERMGRKDPQPSRQGRLLPDVWTQSTVRSILRNPKYTGHQTWKRQRRRHHTDPLTLVETSTMTWNDPDEWVWSDTEVHEPLVSEGLFERAQAIIETKRRVATLHVAKGDQRVHVFRGWLRCRLCGKTMQPHVAHGTVYYRCRYQDEVGPQGLERSGHPKNVYVREDQLIEKIEDWFTQRIFGPERLRLLEADFRKLEGESRDKTPSRIEELEQQLRECREKLTRYKEIFDRGADPDTVAGWVNEASKEQKRLLSALEAERNAPRLEDRIRRSSERLERVPDLSRKLSQTTVAEKRELLGAFDLRATYDCSNETIYVSVDVTAPFFREDEGRIEGKAWGLDGVGGGTRTPTGLRPTRPSTLRVYQFRHSDANGSRQPVRAVTEGRRWRCPCRLSLCCAR